MALLWSVVALAGCGSTVSSVPLIGMPANAPKPAAQSGGYLPVNDLPGNREDAPLNVTQQTAVQQELSALRDKQKAAAAADAAAIAAQPAPQTAAQARSRQTRQ